jgi:cysteine peptidase B
MIRPIAFFALMFFAIVQTVADDQTLFETFKTKYNKQYANAEEEAKRSAIFQANMAKAADMQAADPEATYGMTELSDLSDEEYSAAYLSTSGTWAANRRDGEEPRVEADLPQLAAIGDTIDWRQKGAVSYVRTQGRCGCCWAMTAIQAAEGKWFLAGNKLPTLSTQHLISCDTLDGACRSGFMTTAYDWLVRYRGGRMATEASYPYVSSGGVVPTCADQGKTTGAIITGYVNLPRTEAQMATWLYQYGPIGLAVDARSWQTYRSGVMTTCSAIGINHGVLLVGMGKTSTGQRYWIIKNSWGAGWGESGYVRLAMGRNLCLVTSWPIQPTVKAAATAPMPTGPLPAVRSDNSEETAAPRPPTVSPTDAPTTLPPVTSMLTDVTEASNATQPNATTVPTNETILFPLSNETTSPNATESVDVNGTANPNATADNATYSTNTSASEVVVPSVDPNSPTAADVNASSTALPTTAAATAAPISTESIPPVVTPTAESTTSSTPATDATTSTR